MVNIDYLRWYPHLLGITSIGMHRQAWSLEDNPRKFAGHFNSWVKLLDSTNTPASTTTPLADTSAGAVGSSLSYARSDHTHPDSSLYAKMFEDVSGTDSITNILNANQKAGFIRVGPTVTDMPYTNHWWLGWHYTDTVDYKAIYVSSASNPNTPIWRRSKSAGTWSTWRQDFGTESIIPVANGGTGGSSAQEQGSDISTRYVHNYREAPEALVQTTTLGYSFIGTLNAIVSSAIGLPAYYHHIIHMNHFNGDGYAGQIVIPLQNTNNNGLWFRWANGTTWQAWRRALDNERMLTDIRYVELGSAVAGTGNSGIDFHSNAGNDYDSRIVVPAGTGNLQITPGISGTTNRFIAMYGRSAEFTNVASGADANLYIRDDTSNTPVTICFHRQGVYAVRLGLDIDNKFKVGGYSTGATGRYVLPRVVTVNYPAAASATLTVTGALPTASQTIDIAVAVGQSAAVNEAARKAKFRCSAQAANSVTLVCDGTTPTVQIPLTFTLHDLTW
jgi:hypothetical protein